MVLPHLKSRRTAVELRAIQVTNQITLSTLLEKGDFNIEAVIELKHPGFFFSTTFRI